MNPDRTRPRSARRTKIVATLGPATQSHGAVADLVAAGMDVARINLSHGDRRDHEAAIASVRAAAAEQSASVAVLADLPGPKLRLGDLAAPVPVTGGQIVSLGRPGNADVPVNFPELLGHFEDGQLVLVDDGAVALRVCAVSEASMSLEALDDGVLKSRKGVNAPDTHLPVSALTDIDRELATWAVAHDVDYVALSFVRNAGDVCELKDLIAANGGDQLVVAKIEKKEALASLAEIVAAADAVMLARGDLGVEIDPADVPIWQKRVIHACHIAGRPVITATQMLQSMVLSPRPTRAEASDVANAIYDATGAVMLSGETAVGLYPAEAVRTMSRIALAVEADIDREGRAPQPWAAGRSGISDAITSGACEVAQRLGAAAIVSPTRTGATARAVARHLPPQPILAVSPRRRVVDQLALVWGVTPLLADECCSLEEVVQEAAERAVKAGYAVRGDVLVVTAGVQTEVSGKTNLIKAHRIE